MNPNQLYYTHAVQSVELQLARERLAALEKLVAELKAETANKDALIAALRAAPVVAPEGTAHVD